MATQIQLRRGTSSSWSTANTVLAQGEIGYETDSAKFKIGDGSTAWTGLTYFGANPGGSNQTIQYNNNGSLNGMSGTVWDDTNRSLTLTGATVAGTALTTVAITGAGGQFSCDAATLAVGQTVTISGTLGGTGTITGYSSPTTYRISATNGSTTFTLVNASTGAALTTTAGTPTGLTYVVTSPVFNLSQTWNNSAVTFTGLRFNATDTASAAASLLMDLQVGGTSIFSVGKGGNLNPTLFVYSDNGGSYSIRIGSASTHNITQFGASLLIGTGLFNTDTNIGIKTGNINIASTRSLTWTSSTAYQGAVDLFLSRAAAATLQLGAADAAGASATVTASAAADTITWTSHGIQTGSGVRFTNSGGALPGGITTSITYYAVVVDANTIKIATTYDNATAASPSVVDITSDGTGTTTGYGAKTQQSLKVQSFTGTDIPGSPFVIKGSQGTGNAAGGSIIFQVAPAGTTGTAQNALATALTIASDKSATFAGYVYIAASNKLVLAGSGYGISLDGTIAGSGATLAYDGTYANFYIGVGFRASISSSALRLDSAHQFGWTSSGSNAGTFDTILVRDAANTLALKRADNGATTYPQTFRVYSTTASSGSYGIISAGVQPDGTTAAADTLYIGSAGAGNAMTKLALVVNGTTQLNYGVTTTSSWTYTGSAHNFTGGNIRIDDSRYIFWQTRTILASPADGQLTLWNNTANDFNRLQFGGTTSSFPALKRTPASASLQVRLADDSGDAALQCGTQTAGGTAFNVNGTGGSSIASITNTSTGTLLQVLNSTSNPLMTVTDTTSGTLFSVQSTTAATLFSVNDTTSGTLLAVTNSSSNDVFSVADGGAITGYDDTSANVVAIRNGTSLQTLRVYGTYTSATNYERLFAGYVSAASAFRIGTEKGVGGGTARPLELQADGTTRLTIATGGWTIFGGSIYSGGTGGSPNLNIQDNKADFVGRNGYYALSLGGSNEFELYTYNNNSFANPAFKIAQNGVPTLCNFTATPAAGSTTARVLLGTTAGFGIYYGSGAPTVSAAKGSIYLRSDGTTTNDRLYVNTDGATTWTAVTTAA